MRNHAHSCAKLEVLDNLFRLIGMSDVVRKLLEILLEPLVLLLIISQCLQAFLLGALILVNLVFTGLIYGWVDALAH